MMVQNKDSTGTLSAAEFERRRQAAALVYEKRKKHWKAMGAEKYTVGVRRAAIAALGRKRLQVKPQLKRDLIKRKLEENFEAEINEKMVPSILRAMGVAPKSWAFDTGYNESERAGEAWLVDNDPMLPSETEADIEDETEDGTGASRPPAAGRKGKEKASARYRPY